MHEIIQILISSLILSVIHAAIPNHWLPLVVISRSEKWSFKETIWITGFTGLTHTLSTIVIGIVVGLIGYKLSESLTYFSEIIAPTILILLGLSYIIRDYMLEKRGMHHHHNHFPELNIENRRSKRAIVSSLAIAMFFSPCLEIEAYYFKASSAGWYGILTVSVVYLTVTVLGMILLVRLVLKGLTKLNLHFLEHYEKLTVGIVLLIFGVLSLLLGH